MIDRLPRNAHYQNAFGDIAREHFAKEGVFYIDLWPMSKPFLNSHITAYCYSDLRKPGHVYGETKPPRFFKPICGRPSMFDLPEHKWKPWRAVLSRGFRTDHILSLVPGMVDETIVYCETLRSHALERDMFV